jgi:ferredoxin
VWEHKKKEYHIMKVTVDQEGCIGCGERIEMCPDVFSWDDDTAVALSGPVPENLEDDCREAADACPVDVITIEE